MEFEIGNQRFTARFSFGLDRMTLPHDKMRLARRVTSCQIVEHAQGPLGVEREEAVSSATVICDSRDFRRVMRHLGSIENIDLTSMGMKRALTKAIKATPWTPEMRQQVWLSWQEIFQPVVFHGEHKVNHRKSETFHKGLVDVGEPVVSTPSEPREMATA